MKLSLKRKKKWSAWGDRCVGIRLYEFRQILKWFCYDQKIFLQSRQNQASFPITPTTRFFNLIYCPASCRRTGRERCLLWLWHMQLKTLRWWPSWKTQELETFGVVVNFHFVLGTHWWMFSHWLSDDGAHYCVKSTDRNYKRDKLTHLLLRIKSWGGREGGVSDDPSAEGKLSTCCLSVTVCQHFTTAHAGWKTKLLVQK